MIFPVGLLTRLLRVHRQPLSVRAWLPLVPVLFVLVMVAGSSATVGALAPAPALPPGPGVWEQGVSGADRGTLLVADLREDAVLVVDLDRPLADAATMATRIDLPAAPHELLRLPDGRVVVSLERGGSLALIDAALLTARLVEVGGTPHGLGWDGQHLLVTDRAAGTVRRFDPSGWPGEAGELAPWPAPGWPHAVAALPGGGVAVALAQRDALRLIDAAPDSPDAPAAPEAEPPITDLRTSTMPETVAVAAGRVATAGALGGVVHLFDRAGAALAEWTVGGRPVRVGFAPDGETLAVALSAAGSVALLSPSAPATPPLMVAVGAVPDGLAFDPGGTWLATSDLAAGGVRIIDVATGVQVARIDIGTATGGLLWLDTSPSPTPPPTLPPTPPPTISVAPTTR